MAESQSGRVSRGHPDSNPFLDAALSYSYAPYAEQSGRKKVVAFGDHSHKCPVNVRRVPPCSAACPAGEDVRGMHNLLRGIESSADRRGDPWKDAWRRVTDRNPFPAITGRVCPHPCQQECNRGQYDESVGVNAVEQALGDYGISEQLELATPKPATGRRVAVVGGGPAGLSAAYQLRRLGHAVTLFDANPRLGGMLRYGIMSYRVSRKVLDAEIGRIIDLGVTTRMGVRVGSDVSLEQIESEHDAVFIGIGAQAGRSLPCASSPGGRHMTDALSFLRSFETDSEAPAAGKRVLVVGDGNVAMDVARLALRMGSQAEIVSGVPKGEMACFPEELRAAVREGVTVHELTGTVSVLEEAGEVRGLVCVGMESKERGEEGWNSPIPFQRYRGIAGEEFVLEGDAIVAAIGQSVDVAGLERLTGGSPWLKVDRTYKLSGERNMFAGGDALEVGLIATAIGHGRKAAESIDRFLKGEHPPPRRHVGVIDASSQDLTFFPHSTQRRRDETMTGSAAGNHDEVLRSLDRAETVSESERCMSCGSCLDCKRCLIFCPKEAISRAPAGSVEQVMHMDYSKCVGCHICSLLCPSGFIQMGMGAE